MPRWKTPKYEFKKWNKKVVIDVTTSISPGLPPHQVIKQEFIPLLDRKGNVRRVLDFGAGALRHTFPLLRAGFEVCAVERQFGSGTGAGVQLESNVQWEWHELEQAEPANKRMQLTALSAAADPHTLGCARAVGSPFSPGNAAPKSLIAHLRSR